MVEGPGAAGRVEEPQAPQGGEEAAPSMAGRIGGSPWRTHLVAATVVYAAGDVHHAGFSRLVLVATLNRQRPGRVPDFKVKIKLEWGTVGKR